jgi:lipopolysaccharide/colanic/teichoic acid biosynthesis glycosyltransferase
MGLFLKRLFDVLSSLLALIVLSPVLLVVSLAVLVSMGWPVFFVQERVGKDDRIFSLIKFRTMKKAKADFVSPEDDAARLTKAGQVIRSLSLDELPQLINVLKGDMSIVGPRPLLVRYLPRYSEFQRRRHEVVPGITGWAQINGRNRLTWEERFEHDVWYVDNRSFYLDFKIIMLTVLNVVMRKDVSSEEHVTMSEFMGSDERSA